MSVDRETEPRVSAENNIESWPLWRPADSRGTIAARYVTREIPYPDGSVITATVKIGYSDLGTLTTEDQKTLYGLLLLWERSGRPDVIHFSLRRLLATLERSWGSKDREAVLRSLERLAHTPLTWTRAFREGKHSAPIASLDAFHLLAHLRISDESGDVMTGPRAYCQARFHPLILENLRRFFSRPVLIKTVLSFGSGIAQIIYRHVDLVMADKPAYRRRSLSLFADVGLDVSGGEYRKLSARRRTLERAFRELDGAALGSGGFLRVALESTRDGKDVNAVFTKCGERPASAHSIPSTSASAHPEALPNAAPSTRAQAVALVRDFHRAFHGLADCAPTAKEASQAVQLIRTHGSAIARRAVDFAHAEAVRTNFVDRVQHFGYVLGYVERVVATSRTAAPPVQGLPSALPHPTPSPPPLDAEEMLAIENAEGHRCALDRVPHHREHMHELFGPVLPWEDGYVPRAARA